MTQRLPGPTTKLVLALLSGIIIVGAAARFAYARHVSSPFRADAVYHHDVAAGIADGAGLSVDYAWHYLRDVDELPMPSNGYRMPGMSLYLAGWYASFGTSFKVGQLAGIGLSLVLIALTWWVGREFTGHDGPGLLAAAIAAFDPNFVLFATTTDAPLLHACLLATALVFAHRGCVVDGKWFLAAGLFGGLAHLVRADAVFLVPVTLLCAACAGRKCGYRPRLAHALYLLVPYALVLVPWALRNAFVFGSVLPDDIHRLAFLTNYADLFRLDTSVLSLERFVEAKGGWPGVFVFDMKQLYQMARWTVVGGSSLAVLCAIPFFIVKRPLAALAPLALLVILLLVYAFGLPELAGKGTFTGTLVALLPTLFAAAGAGLWGLGSRTHRRWGASRRTLLLGVLVAMVLTHSVTQLDSVMRGNQLEAEAHPYVLLGPEVAALMAKIQPPDQPMVSDNPQMLHQLTGRPCARVPTDGLDAVRAVSKQLGARYCVLAGSSVAAIDGLAEAIENREISVLAKMPTAEDGETLCILDLEIEVALGHAYDLMDHSNAALKRGDHQAAIHALRGALSFSAGQPNLATPIRARMAIIHTVYGDLLEAAGDGDAAQEQYDFALSVAPSRMGLDDLRAGLPALMAALDRPARPPDP
ncbi:MAG TPA: glycosyltransferase family 39 protein [Armatimonadota bacterium]|nr:glycosyltransferase family 39 protein [Armatimonadota bacterium]